MKNIRIILSILAIIVVGLCLTNVKAIAINDNYFVWQRNDVDQTSRLKKTSTNGDIITSFVGYTENNSFQPAYCNNAQKDGVGGVHNHPGYTVNVTGLADAAAWRVISNGYPYKTPAELGVDNEYDAFTATKHAVYVVIGQSPVRVYAGKDERGRKVVNAIRNLSSKAVGANGLSNYTAPNFIINESNITEEGDYIVKTIRGTSNTINAEAINVSLNNAPSGTVISDLNGNIKTVFNDNEVIKISVFKKSINIKTSFQINIDAKFASYKVYFGKALSSNLQDYYMTSEKYEYAKATSNFVYELPKKTCDDVIKNHEQCSKDNTCSKEEKSEYEACVPKKTCDDVIKNHEQCSKDNTCSKEEKSEYEACVPKKTCDDIIKNHEQCSKDNTCSKEEKSEYEACVVPLNNEINPNTSGLNVILTSIIIITSLSTGVYAYQKRKALEIK